MLTNPSSPESSSSTEPSSEKSQPGPSLLAERSVVGILVHLVATIPVWGVVVPGLVYRFSSHDFTRANARNGLNWQVLVTGAWVVALVGLFGLSALTNRITLPGAIETLLSLPVFAAVIASFVLSGLNFVLPLIAMGKAIFGSAWAYPFVPDFLHFVATRSKFGRE